jgi:hypothetical protein
MTAPSTARVIAARRGHLPRLPIRSHGTAKRSRKTRTQMRFAGARYIISGSMPINRRKLQVPRLTFSKQGRLWRSLSRGPRVVPLRRRLLLLHRQLLLVLHLLPLCDLLPHHGPSPSQGLARPHHRAQRPRNKTGLQRSVWGAARRVRLSAEENG